MIGLPWKKKKLNIGKKQRDKKKVKGYTYLTMKNIPGNNRQILWKLRSTV